MKKLLSLVVVLMFCLVLTGCYGTIVNVNINSDATGTVAAQIGFSEAAYAMIKSLEEGSQVVDDELKETTPFVYNGKTYYGTNEKITFSNIEDFNDKMSGLNDDEEIESGIFVLAKENDGNFSLTLSITSETANTDEVKENMSSLNLSETQLNRLMQDMVIKYTFNMPGMVTQVAGDNAGITINGKTLIIDFLKLDIPKDAGATKTYSFVANAQSVGNSSRFTDVPTTLWSCKAINVLAEGGLVAGVGEGRFSPERGMKISEFCQVLTNAMGLESGADETGYWAAKAIKSCIDEGYIYSHGEIIPQIYDEVITREEAIAAMQLASARPQIAGNNITIENIPDGDQISDKYKALILQAYNSGITTGVNEQLKFSPKNKLTRGQVCQLFYNVNWTTPINR